MGLKNRPSPNQVNIAMRALRKQIGNCGKSPTGGTWEENNQEAS